MFKLKCLYYYYTAFANFNFAKILSKLPNIPTFLKNIPKFPLSSQPLNKILRLSFLNKNKKIPTA